MIDHKDKTINRSPAAGCPACEAMRLHTEADWKQFHPFAGHGHSREHGAKKKEDAGKEQSV